MTIEPTELLYRYAQNAARLAAKMTDTPDPVEGPETWVVGSDTWNADDAVCTDVRDRDGNLVCDCRVQDAPLIARAPAMASEIATLKADLSAAETTVRELAGSLEILDTADGVHIAILRGSIAKPTPAQIGHLYRGEDAVAVVAEVWRQNAEAFAGDEIATLKARVAELVSGLVSIRDMEDRPYEGPHFDPAAVDACPECQRYAGHPIQNGICDEHRRPFYARQKHDASEKGARGYRASSIARSLLSKLEGGE